MSAARVSARFVPIRKGFARCRGECARLHWLARRHGRGGWLRIHRRTVAKPRV